ncbi:MAG: universal stress protein [Saprospiraceae bacterium]|nr:universal stress protein [Saprospiraceae bacterium]
MKNILLPIDFSKGAEISLLFGLQLAQKEKAKAIVLHIVSPYGGLTEGVFQIYDYAVYLDEKRKALQDYISKFRTKNNIQKVVVETICESGIAAEEIINYSIKNDSCLIVLGSRGTGNISKILLGSTSQSVMSMSKTPLMIIPQGFKFESFNKKVCFATDFHLKFNKKSLQLFDQFDFLNKATIEFVHVHSAKQEVFREKHAELVALLFGKLKIIIKYILSDQFEESIDAYMQASESGLLVMLPHQRNFLYYLFFSGHTLAVVKKLHYPVLILYEG